MGGRRTRNRRRDPNRLTIARRHFARSRQRTDTHSSPPVSTAPIRLRQLTIISTATLTTSPLRTAEVSPNTRPSNYRQATPRSPVTWVRCGKQFLQRGCRVPETCSGCSVNSGPQR